MEEEGTEEGVGVSSCKMAVKITLVNTTNRAVLIISYFSSRARMRKKAFSKKEIFTPLNGIAMFYFLVKLVS